MTADSLNLAPTPSSNLLNTITDALYTEGYVIVENFLPETLATALYGEAQMLSPLTFSAAGIGRNANAQVNSNVRSDHTLWLSEESALQQHYLSYMEALRLALNRRLFLGLFDFECHYSHYKQGDFYQKHVDAFKGASSRIISTVFYLNPEWKASDEGQLALYQSDADDQPQLIPPMFNRCVIFLSDTFPHEVLGSQADRYSIAGWYRVAPT